MPDYPTLQLPSQFPLDENIEFEEIVRRFGDGYDHDESVGSTDGIRSFRFAFNTLTQSSGQSVYDAELDDDLTRAVSLWEFFKRRKRDGSPFWVCAPRDEANVLVKFWQSRLKFKRQPINRFMAEVELREHKLPS
jgi:hypothetical protein